jgi:hypothetical protein
MYLCISINGQHVALEPSWKHDFLARYDRVEWGAGAFLPSLAGAALSREFPSPACRMHLQRKYCIYMQLIY